MSKIQLADRSASWNFAAGIPIVISKSGRRLLGWRLLAWRIGQRAIALTRWWRPRTVVSAVDQEAGIVTLVDERWSWRRWRWERAS